MTSSSVSWGMTSPSRFAVGAIDLAPARPSGNETRQLAPLDSRAGRGRTGPLRHASAVYSLTPPCTSAAPPGCASRLWLPSAGTLTRHGNGRRGSVGRAFWPGDQRTNDPHVDTQ